MGCGKSKKKNDTTAEDDFFVQYKLGKELGDGAGGVVYEAENLKTKDIVAVKLVDKECASQPDIDKEVELMRMLKHPNVNGLLEVFDDEDFTYVVMRIFRGGDLVDGLQAYHENEVSKGHEKKLVQLCRQLAKSLAYIHDKSILHRDIKSDNFLVDRKDIGDPECLLVLTDFGASQVLQKGQTVSGTNGTTREYWSPELIAGKYGHSYDVWASGVCIYGLLTGDFPFADEREAVEVELDPAPVCHRANDLVMGMLNKDSSKRLEAQQCVDHKWLREGADSADSDSDEELKAPPPPPAARKGARKTMCIHSQVPADLKKRRTVLMNAHAAGDTHTCTHRRTIFAPTDTE